MNDGYVRDLLNLPANSLPITSVLTFSEIDYMAMGKAPHPVDTDTNISHERDWCE